MGTTSEVPNMGQVYFVASLKPWIFFALKVMPLMHLSHFPLPGRTEEILAWLKQQQNNCPDSGTFDSFAVYQFPKVYSSYATCTYMKVWPLVVPL